MGICPDEIHILINTCVINESKLSTDSARSIPRAQNCFNQSEPPILLTDPETSSVHKHNLKLNLYIKKKMACISRVILLLFSRTIGVHLNIRVGSTLAAQFGLYQPQRSF